MARNFENVLKEEISEHQNIRYNLETACQIDSVKLEDFYKIVYFTTCKGSMLISSFALLQYAKKEEDADLRKNIGNVSISLFQNINNLMSTWRDLINEIL
jgi:hypothetical protein